MQLLVTDVFPQGGGSSSVNYQPRLKYEQEVALRLNSAHVVVLHGRSGYGKTSIAMQVLRTEVRRNVSVACESSGSYIELLRLILREITIQTMHPFVSSLWLGVTRIRELQLPGIGGTFSEDVRKSLENKVVVRANRHDLVILIERAERLDGSSRNHLIEFFNDRPDGPQAERPRILCLSIKPIASAPDQRQQDRFQSVEIRAFAPTEIANQIRCGLRQLGVKITERAVEFAVKVCRGSPLACSTLIAETLLKAGIVQAGDIPDYEIRLNELDTAAESISSGKQLSPFWRRLIETPEDYAFEVLLAMLRVGHEGAIDDIRAQLAAPRRASARQQADVASCVRLIALESILGDYADLTVEGERYSFKEPFLYEHLRCQIVAR